MIALGDRDYSIRALLTEESRNEHSANWSTGLTGGVIQLLDYTVNISSDKRQYEFLIRRFNMIGSEGSDVIGNPIGVMSHEKVASIFTQALRDKGLFPVISTPTPQQEQHSNSDVVADDQIHAFNHLVFLPQSQAVLLDALPGWDVTTDSKFETVWKRNYQLFHGRQAVNKTPSTHHQTKSNDHRSGISASRANSQTSSSTTKPYRLHPQSQVLSSSQDSYNDDDPFLSLVESSQSQPTPGDDLEGVGVGVSVEEGVGVGMSVEEGVGIGVSVSSRPHCTQGDGLRTSAGRHLNRIAVNPKRADVDDFNVMQSPVRTSTQQCVCEDEGANVDVDVDMHEHETELQQESQPQSQLPMEANTQFFSQLFDNDMHTHEQVLFDTQLSPPPHSPNLHSDIDSPACADKHMLEDMHTRVHNGTRVQADSHKSQTTPQNSKQTSGVYSCVHTAMPACTQAITHIYTRKHTQTSPSISNCERTQTPKSKDVNPDPTLVDKKTSQKSGSSMSASDMSISNHVFGSAAPAVSVDVRTAEDIVEGVNNDMSPAECVVKSVSDGANSGGEFCDTLSQADRLHPARPQTSQSEHTDAYNRMHAHTQKEHVNNQSGIPILLSPINARLQSQPQETESGTSTFTHQNIVADDFSSSDEEQVQVTPVGQSKRYKSHEDVTVSAAVTSARVSMSGNQTSHTQVKTHDEPTTIHKRLELSVNSEHGHVQTPSNTEKVHTHEHILSHTQHTVHTNTASPNTMLGHEHTPSHAQHTIHTSAVTPNMILVPESPSIDCSSTSTHDILDSTIKMSSTPLTPPISENVDICVDASVDVTKDDDGTTSVPKTSTIPTNTGVCTPASITKDKSISCSKVGESGDDDGVTPWLFKRKSAFELHTETAVSSRQQTRGGRGDESTLSPFSQVSSEHTSIHTSQSQPHSQPSQTQPMSTLSADAMDIQPEQRHTALAHTSPIVTNISFTTSQELLLSDAKERHSSSSQSFVSQIGSSSGPSAIDIQPGQRITVVKEKLQDSSEISLIISQEVPSDMQTSQPQSQSHSLLVAQLGSKHETQENSSQKSESSLLEDTREKTSRPQVSQQAVSPSVFENGTRKDGTSSLSDVAEVLESHAHSQLTAYHNEHEKTNFSSHAHAQHQSQSKAPFPNCTMVPSQSSPTTSKTQLQAFIQDTSDLYEQQSQNGMSGSSLSSEAGIRCSAIETSSRSHLLSLSLGTNEFEKSMHRSECRVMNESSHGALLSLEANYQESLGVHSSLRVHGSERDQNVTAGGESDVNSGDQTGNEDRGGGANDTQNHQSTSGEGASGEDGKNNDSSCSSKNNAEHRCEEGNKKICESEDDEISESPVIYVPNRPKSHVRCISILTPTPLSTPLSKITSTSARASSITQTYPSTSQITSPHVLNATSSHNPISILEHMPLDPHAQTSQQSVFPLSQNPSEKLAYETQLGSQLDLHQHATSRAPGKRYERETCSTPNVHAEKSCTRQLSHSVNQKQFDSNTEPWSKTSESQTQLQNVCNMQVFPGKPLHLQASQRSMENKMHELEHTPESNQFRRREPRPCSKRTKASESMVFPVVRRGYKRSLAFLYSAEELYVRPPVRPSRDDKQNKKTNAARIQAANFFMSLPWMLSKDK
eukprot:CFRG5058T1